MNKPIALNRRRFMGSAAATVAAAQLGLTAQAPSGATAVRPFQINFPDADLDELRRRIKAARWPDRETVSDNSQGVPLELMQQLAAYWSTDYDWRKCEAKLNALPEFVTEIDGLDIQFIHVRSKHANALPLIVTHGWPGSIIEQLKIIEPLTDPTAHGGNASDAFHVVIPSIPGYGFSAKPTATAWSLSKGASNAAPPVTLSLSKGASNAAPPVTLSLSKGASKCSTPCHPELVEGRLKCRNSQFNSP